LTNSIISTRAITINASSAEVWKVLSQLGADRSGFFAYTFLEELLGYHTQKQSSNEEFSLDTNRIIPTSVQNNQYSFPVIMAKKDEYVVLKGWGAFVLNKINDSQTRLIIRTYELKTNTQYNEFFNQVFAPFHYMMEKRMMLGIQAKAQKNSNIKNYFLYDMIWFFGIIFTAMGMLFLVFLRKSIVLILMLIICSNLWIYGLLIFDPLSYASLYICLFVYLNLIIFSVLSVKSQKKEYFERAKS